MAIFLKDDIEKNKAFAALVIFPVFFVFYFLFGSESAYVKYCAKQGMFLTVCFLVVSLAAKLLTWIPLFGKIFSLIFWVIDGILILITVVQMIRAVRGTIGG